MSPALPSAFAQPEVILPDAIYTSAEVARLVFRNTVVWWYRNRKRIAAEGFPRPISKHGQPKYRGADLIAWCARDKTGELVATTMLGANSNVLQLRFNKLRKRNSA